MTKRRVLDAACVLALVVGNVGQFLWIWTSDTVRYLSKPELEAKITQLNETHRGSAAWVRALANSPNLVVVEASNLMNLRSIFGQHVQREIYVWDERKDQK